MEPELGVLLALLLKGSSAYNDSYQTLIRDLLARNNTPRRISWEGQQEPLDEDELVLCMLTHNISLLISAVLQFRLNS